jgi:Spy/CpxP family protein refolding chaperone
MRARLTTLVLAGALMAAPTDAQHPQRRGQAADSGMMAAGMHMMMAGPEMVLHLREPLELSPAQVQRIEAIRDSVQREHRPHAHAAMRAMGEAGAMLEASNPDLSRYEARLREAADHYVQAHAAMARGWLRAREVLTPEQRSNLRFGMKVMQQMMAEHMQAMMPGMMGMMRQMMPGTMPGRMPDTTRRPPRG